MRGRILVAGMGNILLRDDGFGVEVARALAQDPLPDAVQVIEVGIGGIHILHELLHPRDGLILVDALDLGRPPGTLYLGEPRVPEPAGSPTDGWPGFPVDMHRALPSSVLLLAKALGVLPPKVLLVGCQPLTCDELGIGLTEPVARAVGHAIAHIRQTIRAWLELPPRK